MWSTNRTNSGCHLNLHGYGRTHDGQRVDIGYRPAVCTWSWGQRLRGNRRRRDGRAWIRARTPTGTRRCISRTTKSDVARGGIAVRTVSGPFHGVAGGREEFSVGEYGAHGQIVAPLAVRRAPFAGGNEDVLSRSGEDSHHDRRKLLRPSDHVGDAYFIVGVRGKRAVSGSRVEVENVDVFQQREIAGVDMRDLHEGIRKAAGAFIDRPGIPQLILREGGSGDARVHAIEPALPVGSLRLVSLPANPFRDSDVRRSGSGIRFIPGKDAECAGIDMRPKKCGGSAILCHAKTIQILGEEFFRRRRPRAYARDGNANNGPAGRLPVGGK